MAKLRQSLDQELLSELTRELNSLVESVRSRAISQEEFLSRLETIRKNGQRIKATQRQGQLDTRIDKSLTRSQFPTRGGSLALRPATTPLQRALQQGAGEGRQQAARSARLERMRGSVRARLGAIDVPGAIGATPAVTGTESPFASLRPALERVQRAPTPRGVARAGQQAVTRAKGLAATRRGLKGAGLGAAGVAILSLLASKAFSGGAKKKEVDPAAQMQMLQLLGAGGGRGNAPVDPALAQGRELRNQISLLKIIEMVRGLENVALQPTAGIV